MTLSFQKRLYTHIRQTLDRYPGAWMLWCDPSGVWLPLLQRIAADQRMGGFSLLTVSERIGGHLGGPVARQQIEERLVAGESFVLHVPAAPDQLGWLWGQALLAEQWYTRSLREQLLAWGWRPGALTVDDRQLAEMARQNLQQDPAEWGSSGVQPDVELLLAVLAGREPGEEGRYVLDLTLELTGLPALTADDLPIWRQRALARLLVTEAHAAAPGAIPENHTLLISPPQRSLALHLLARWIDSKEHSRSLPELVIEADKIAALATPLLNQSIATVDPLLSQSGERTLFAAACRRLAEQGGVDLLTALADLAPHFERHARGFWGRAQTHPQALPWGELLRLSDAARQLLDARPQGSWSSVDRAVAWYTGRGWRMDQAGEEFLRNLAYPRPELLALIAPLRSAYRALWEESAIAWSTLWKSAGSPLPKASTSGEWLKARLAESNRPTAILMVDALRYALGATLAERLNHQEGEVRATVETARAPLPSITPLGMGMALPIEEGQFRADLDNGKWQLLAGSKQEPLTTAAQRRSWWLVQGGVAEGYLLDLAALQSGDLPSPRADATRLVVYDASIDTLGHDDELESSGSAHLLDRYLRAAEQLRNAGWKRILMVTDHGYLHWPGSEEKNAPSPLPHPAYSSRRALAYPSTTSFDGPQGLAPGGRWRIAVPHGVASFRAYGGLGYFHGGASLQEWIIPCVQVVWPVQAQPVEIGLEPLPKVLSLRPQVTLSVARPSLLQEDTLSRTVEVLIRDVQTGAILFRSGQTLVRGDNAQERIGLQAVEGVTADRGASVRIELREAHTEKVLASAESVLLVALAGW